MPWQEPTTRATRPASPGDQFVFHPTSDYDYPERISSKRDQVVTYLETNGGYPPAHVQWADKTTYWVEWEDLLVPGHTDQTLAEVKEKDEKWSEGKRANGLNSKSLIWSAKT